jgi:hypothetical protein
LSYQQLGVKKYRRSQRRKSEREKVKKIAVEEEKVSKKED